MSLLWAIKMGKIMITALMAAIENKTHFIGWSNQRMLYGTEKWKTALWNKRWERNKSLLYEDAGGANKKQIGSFISQEHKVNVWMPCGRERVGERGGMETEWLS